MYEPELVLRLRKNGKTVLTAEEAEELMALKDGKISESKSQYASANGLSKEGEEILSEYLLKLEHLKDSLKNAYRNPAPTVDGIVSSGGKIVLVKRKNEPYQGMYALPGGFVEYGESVEDAVIREIKEETGLCTRISNLVGVYSSPDRDPRQHTLSVVFHLSISGGSLDAGDDAADVKWFSLDELPPLAFDHEEIIKNWKSNFKVR